VSGANSAPKKERGLAGGNQISRLCVWGRQGSTEGPEKRTECFSGKKSALALWDRSPSRGVQKKETKTTRERGVSLESLEERHEEGYQGFGADQHPREERVVVKEAGARRGNKGQGLGLSRDRWKRKTVRVKKKGREGRASRRMSTCGREKVRAPKGGAHEGACHRDPMGHEAKSAVETRI